ncbi:nucleotidyltransferase domain-containing protein [Stutzerimonas kirkiae]|nr:nucleotidyltransferase domain-containing protein [Stutzerimonas kirkiae]TBV15401.1 nucleotidyltransferase domain-containing protein [Stutzerimonas kirkiae]
MHAGERGGITNHRLPSSAEALAIADTLLRTRYAGASFAYVAGSIMRGQGTYLSDIDLVVIHDHLDAAYRESFVAQGIPVEAFVHDRQTLAWFVDADVNRGRPCMLNMIVEGVIIGPAPEPAERLRQGVSERLAKGPPPLTLAALDALRYEITDAIDDLRGIRPASEMISIGAALHAKLVELALRGRGRWYGTGKRAPRLLSELDQSLADRFDDAFRVLFVSADAEPVIRLAEDELAPHGGFLFDGDCRRAPLSCRA